MVKIDFMERSLSVSDTMQRAARNAKLRFRIRYLNFPLNSPLQGYTGREEVFYARTKFDDASDRCDCGDAGGVGRWSRIATRRKGWYEAQRRGMGVTGGGCAVDDSDRG